MQDSGTHIPHLQSSPDSPWPFDPDARGFRPDVAAMFIDGFADAGTDSSGEVRVCSLSVDRQSMSVHASMKLVHGGNSVSFQGHAEFDGRDYAVMWFHGLGALVADKEAVMSFEGDLSGVDMKLSPAALSEEPDRVYSITLMNPNMTRQDSESRDDGSVAAPEMTIRPADGDPVDVRIVAGNNILLGKIDSSENGMFGISANGMPFLSEIGDALVISAYPGAGSGRMKADCEEDGLPGTVVADSLGNVVVETDDCYQVEMDTARGVVRVVGKCTACCQCDDYVASGDRMAAESRDLLGVQGKLLSDAELYNDGVRRFNGAVSGAWWRR